MPGDSRGTCVNAVKQKKKKAKTYETQFFTRASIARKHYPNVSNFTVIIHTPYGIIIRTQRVNFVFYLASTRINLGARNAICRRRPRAWPEPFCA